MSNPVSFGAFLGDWARYIPADTPRRKVMAAAFLAQIATLVPFGFGLVTASIIAAKAPTYFDAAAPNYVGGLLAVSPGWYFLPLCLIALIGGMSTGTTALYGTGLDFSSVFPQFSRVQATLFIGALSMAFIFVGRFAFNLVQSISTFAVLIVTCTAPWMVVMMIGFVTRRGWYDSDALQVFNRRQRGGRYWFNHGWNWRGLGAWLLAPRSASASSTCPASSSAPSATSPTASTSACRSPSASPRCSTWRCCGSSPSRVPSTARAARSSPARSRPRSPRSPVSADRWPVPCCTTCRTRCARACRSIPATRRWASPRR